MNAPSYSLAKYMSLAWTQIHKMRGKSPSTEREPAFRFLHQAGPCKTTESIVQVTVVPETEAFAPVIVYFVAEL